MSRKGTDFEHIDRRVDLVRALLAMEGGMEVDTGLYRRDGSVQFNASVRDRDDWRLWHPREYQISPSDVERLRAAETIEDVLSVYRSIGFVTDDQDTRNTQHEKS